MIRFAKAHGYGNDFLYVLIDAVTGVDEPELARQMCDRRFGIGADGLVLYRPAADGAVMRLFNADGSRAEVSGNGLRGLAALLSNDRQQPVPLTIETEGGTKRLAPTGQDGTRQTFRAAMGLPRDIGRETIVVGDEAIDLVVLNIGNPQAVVLGPLPNESTFLRLGAALEFHPRFPDRTNVEFVEVEGPTSIRIKIWERGVGPSVSSGTGSCASLVAAASFGGVSRTAHVVAEGGTQLVEWLDDSVYLTGWAEVVCVGDWLRELPR
jgi:diaminopimelate epimerase